MEEPEEDRLHGEARSRPAAVQRGGGHPQEVRTLRGEALSVSQCVPACPLAEERQ